MERRTLWIACFLLCGGAADCLAQQATVGNNFGRQNDGFHEQIGVNWGLNFPGGHFQFGRGEGANNGGAGFGLGFGNGDVNGRLDIVGAQSSSRSSGSVAPSATMMNGFGAMIADVEQRPFVMGIVPVVGGIPGFGGGVLFNQAAPVPPIRERVARLNQEPKRAPQAKAAPAPRAPADRPAANRADRPDLVADKLAAARESTAGQGAESVADIRRRQQAADAEADQELAEYLASAEEAEAAGKLASARIFYQMAARRAAEPLKSELAARSQRLGR